MKRRNFIKAASAGFLPLALNGLPIQTYAQSEFLQMIQQAASANGRILVLIQLNGGNDGLNTLIPIDQYSNLQKARSNVIIPESKVLTLSDTSITGLHPSMSKVRELYDNGKVSIIQDVGYPNPDFSHFRSTDIWMAGSGSENYLKTGWIGRTLSHVYDGYPTGYPNAAMPDPPAIQIGYGVSLSLLGHHGSVGMALSDPNYVYQMLTEQVDDAPNTPAGHELTYIRLVAQQTEAYSIAVKQAAEKAQNKSTLYPANNRLAEQLKLVARLAAGGLKTPVYVVSIGGFDTHANQVDVNDTTKGLHANLLQQVSEAVFAFQDDCVKLGIGDKVCSMTFSEFGRRIRSNGSVGTDHGTAAPLFVFSKKVNPGIIGNNPIIPSNTIVNDNIPMQFDYRDVYWTMIKEWFQIDSKVIENDILLDTYDTLPIFAQNLTVKQKDNTNKLSLSQNFPNPFIHQTQINFFSPGGQCTLNLYDYRGKKIRVLLQKNMPHGIHEFSLDGQSLKPGNYYYQLITPLGRDTKQMIKG